MSSQDGVVEEAGGPRRSLDSSFSELSRWRQWNVIGRLWHLFIGFAIFNAFVKILPS